MPIKYCPHNQCGAKFDSPYEKPAKFCPSCGKSLSSAFATVVVPAARPTEAPAYQEPLPAAPTRTFRDRHGNDISAQYQRPTTSRPSNGHDAEDYYDRGAMQAEAAELAASIRGGFGAVGERPRPVRFGDLDNVKQALADAQAAQAPKKKRSRK